MFGIGLCGGMAFVKAYIRCEVGRGEQRGGEALESIVNYITGRISDN